MARTRYATDRGLIARMGATMFLLGLVFTGFVIALYFVIDIYSHRNGQSGTSGASLIVFVVLIGLAMAFGSYYWSDSRFTPSSSAAAAAAAAVAAATTRTRCRSSCWSWWSAWWSTRSASC